MKKKKKNSLLGKKIFIWIFIFVGLITLSIEIVKGVSWIEESYDNLNYTFAEDKISIHNLKENITSWGEHITFEIVATETNYPFYWTNYLNEKKQFLVESLPSWIYINNLFLGNLTFNSTLDNQTGFFQIYISVRNLSSEKTDTSKSQFGFIINATNDAPEFIVFPNETESRYADGDLLLQFEVFDEEEHYPLNFSVIFNPEGYKPAQWNNKDVPLLEYNWTNNSNTNHTLIFKNLSRNDTGIYNITVCVNDTLPPEENLPFFRKEDYNVSKQTCKDFILDLRTKLEVSENCSNIKTMLDNETVFCQIEITTEFHNSTIAAWSNASLVNSIYNKNVKNRSWFFKEISSNATNYTKVYNVSLGPFNKSNIGNWSIIFSANDTTERGLLEPSSSPKNEAFNLLINRSNNSQPKLDVRDNSTDLNGNSLELPVNYDRGLDIFITDEDLAIIDKEVYNESFIENISFFNRSDGSKIEGKFKDNESISGASLVSNRILKTLFLKPSQDDIGNYTVNISVTDKSGGRSNEVSFNLTIRDNEPPKWNKSRMEINCTVPSNNGSNVTCKYLDINNDLKEVNNSFILNLSNSSNGIIWASDKDEKDDIIYTLKGSPLPKNFNLINNSLLTFTPWKQDVGYWEFNISAKDSVLHTDSTWVLNITNENSRPEVFTFNYTINETSNGTIESGSVINLTQKDILNLTLVVKDLDLLIVSEQLQEEITTNFSFSAFDSSNENKDLFQFSDSKAKKSGETKIYSESFSFQNINSTYEDYSVNLTVKDNDGESVNLSFILNISKVYDPPFINMSSLTERHYAIGQIFEFKINAEDPENGSLSYNYTLENKIYDSSLGRNTSLTRIFDDGDLKEGVLSVGNLSESHAGVYFINVSARSNVSNLSGYVSLHLYVYDVPNITFPEDGFLFEGVENTTLHINFSVNHSVGSNLFYKISFSNITCINKSVGCNNTHNFSQKGGNLSLSGNGTNVSFHVPLNFSDESYGENRTLMLQVSPSRGSGSLSIVGEGSLIVSKTWNLSITHKNFPINFKSSIGNKSTSRIGKINIDLTEYLEDVDAIDPYYAQNVSFFIESNETDSRFLINANPFEKNISFENLTHPGGWKLVVSLENQSLFASEELIITAFDLNENGTRLTNSTSDKFKVSFTEEVAVIEKPTPSPSSGGSSLGSSGAPYSLKIIVPGSVSIFPGEKVVIPIELLNEGKFDLKDIDLSSILESSGVPIQSIPMFFNENNISILKAGERKTSSLTLNANFNLPGLYDITVTASSKNPSYSDWGKIQIIIPEIDYALERLIFAEKMIDENPKCLEIREVIVRARNLYERGGYSESLVETNLAIDACNRVLESGRLSQVFYQGSSLEDKIFRYVFIISALSIGIGILYYLIRRQMIKRRF